MLISFYREDVTGKGIVYGNGDEAVGRAVEVGQGFKMSRCEGVDGKVVVVRKRIRVRLKSHTLNQFNYENIRVLNMFTCNTMYLIKLLKIYYYHPW